MRFQMCVLLGSMRRKKRKRMQREMRAAWGKGPRPRHRREDIALLDWWKQENKETT
jgi:hypothetical protein